MYHDNAASWPQPHQPYYIPTGGRILHISQIVPLQLLLRHSLKHENMQMPVCTEQLEVLCDQANSQYQQTGLKYVCGMTLAGGLCKSTKRKVAAELLIMLFMEVILLHCLVWLVH